WSSTTNSADPPNLSLAKNQTSTTNTNSGSSNSVPAGMVYVRGGQFTMGRNDGDETERPAHSVTVNPFYIDIYEVTNQNYEEFVKTNKHQAPNHWSNGPYPNGARKPVTNVTRDHANAFCKWAKKQLPPEKQLEFAARGTDNRIYPWGNDWQQNN